LCKVRLKNLIDRQAELKHNNLSSLGEYTTYCRKIKGQIGLIANGDPCHEWKEEDFPTLSNINNTRSIYMFTLI
jgi:hypothetical protein